MTTTVVGGSRRSSPRPAKSPSTGYVHAPARSARSATAVGRRGIRAGALGEQADGAITRLDARRDHRQPLQARHQVLLEQEAVGCLRRLRESDRVALALAASPAELPPDV